jgi:hypothetical protein
MWAGQVVRLSDLDLGPCGEADQSPDLGDHPEGADAGEVQGAVDHLGIPAIPAFTSLL